MCKRLKICYNGFSYQVLRSASMSVIRSKNAKEEFSEVLNSYMDDEMSDICVLIVSSKFLRTSNNKIRSNVSNMKQFEKRLASIQRPPTYPGCFTDELHGGGPIMHN